MKNVDYVREREYDLTGILARARARVRVYKHESLDSRLKSRCTNSRLDLTPGYDERLSRGRGNERSEYISHAANAAYH